MHEFLFPEISVSGDKVYTEDDWADTETKDGYTKSKILAEKAAWDFLKELPGVKKYNNFNIVISYINLLLSNLH